ncbi:MAG: hypothetical protein GX765_06485 [Candidatus Moranbacteria bacterium]|nr:hypothetical protein [Candidatus Moranbacteria bacterium]
MIEIYNDYTHKPIRRVEGRSFNLEPGDSTNYTWRDTAGTWFGYIDPGSPVPNNLSIDCRRTDGCKWLRVPPWEKNTAEVMMPGSVFTPKP